MISAIVMMLIVGGILGAILGIAGKVFYVEPDTRVETVAGMLPQYNCGGCGYAGCSGMAEALVNGESTPDQCKPSKPEVKEKIKAFLAENCK